MGERRGWRERTVQAIDRTGNALVIFWVTLGYGLVLTALGFATYRTYFSEEALVGDTRPSLAESPHSIPPPEIPPPEPIREKPLFRPRVDPAQPGDNTASRTAELNLRELAKYADKVETIEVEGVLYDIWKSKNYDQTYVLPHRA